MLTENEITHYYDAILEEIEPKLIGTSLVIRGHDVPEGITAVTLHELEKLEGDVALGRKGAPIPREIAKMKRKSVPIIRQAFGFKLDDQDLKASRRSRMPIETGAARQCARLIAESVEEMIFNGFPDWGTQGIYKHAGKQHTIETPWNTRDADPFNDIVNLTAKLRETRRYNPKFMVLGPLAHSMLSKTNKIGISYMKMIEDSGLFPNGKDDIYIAPARANSKKAPIIPDDGGLIGDYGPDVAERYAQKMPLATINGDSSHYGDIGFYPVDDKPDKEMEWHFNLITFQGMGIHYNDAFVKLKNLVKIPETVEVSTVDSKSKKGT